MFLLYIHGTGGFNAINPIQVSRAVLQKYLRLKVLPAIDLKKMIH